MCIIGSICQALVKPIYFLRSLQIKESLEEGNHGLIHNMTLTTLKYRLASFARRGALRNAVPSGRISLASWFTFLLIHLGNLQCHRQVC